MCLYRKDLFEKEKNNAKLNAYSEYALSTVYLVEAFFSVKLSERKLVIQLSFVP